MSCLRISKSFWLKPHNSYPICPAIVLDLVVNKRRTMALKIEIHDYDTANTGQYKVLFENPKSVGNIILLSEQEVDSLLDLRQKEDFFIGKYKFTIKSEYDIKFLTQKLAK